jgi:hypothetical protein
MLKKDVDARGGLASKATLQAFEKVGIKTSFEVIGKVPERVEEVK